MARRNEAAEMFSLAGKTSVVTGASGALGSEICIRFAQAGSDLVLLGRQRDKLEAVKRAVEAEGRRADVAVADVLSEEAVSRVADSLGKRVDVLVNAHGTNKRIPTVDMPLSEWERVVDTNLKGTFITCRAFGRLMIGQPGGGKIVNVSSSTGTSGYRWGYSAYSPSKGGVDALTRTLAVEWGRFHVNVNAVAPYFVYTEFTKKFLGDPEVHREIVGDVPLGRLGQPSDVVGAVLFLAAPASDWVTGQVILLDGGFSAH